MKFQCPSCQWNLEKDEQWIGQQVNCPSCGRNFLISAAAAKKSPPGNNTSEAIHKVSTGRGGGSGKGWFLAIFVMMLLFGFACYKVNEPPQEVWKQIVVYVGHQIQPVPPPVAQVTPVPAPAEISPPKAPPPSPSPIKVVKNVGEVHTPPPAPDPLSWVLNHKDYRPQEVTLLTDITFPISSGGKVVGTGNVPSGSKVHLVQISPDKRSVTVTCAAYGNSPVTVSLQSTDLVDRAKAAMAQADTGAKAAEAQRLLASTLPPKPTPPVKTPPHAPTSAASPQPDLANSQTSDGASGFIHPGLLHSDEDFRRMRENLNREPWQSSWQKLISNRHASLDWEPRAVSVVVRGKCDQKENYALLFNDIAAAYACALRWRLSGDTHYADKSVEIMNAWSSTLTQITGSSDSHLAAGIYGYEFANAAEIMRTYDGWKPEDFARFQGMMLNIFYPMNHDFLMNHNGTKIDHYWANWDACNMASIIAIGVLCDRRDIYGEGVEYYKHGQGNGAIEQAVYCIHPDGLGQWQESGRDQGHATLGIGLIGAVCEMAWKQGDDLYGYDNNRFLAGCEYVAKYNLGQDVPYKPYSDSLATQDVISPAGRGDTRPIWELVYNHYVKLKGLDAPYMTQMAQQVRPEGGGGDYGPNSGGFDQLGYGTLTATLP